MMATATPRIEDLVERSFDELDALVREQTAALRGAQRVLGPALAAIERKGRRDGLTALGVTSLSIYMESRGLSPGEGFAMRSAAEACQLSPEVAKAVEDRTLSVPKAALLEPMLKKPELRRPDEDLVGAAQRLTTKELRNELNKRKAGAQLPDKPVARTLFFSRAGVDALVRTRELVSNARKRSVSESEAAEEALSAFVSRNDPEQKALRAMRRREKREAKERGKHGNAASGIQPPHDEPSRLGASPANEASKGASSRIASGASNGIAGGNSNGNSIANGRAPRNGTPSAKGNASRNAISRCRGSVAVEDERHGRYIAAEDRHRVLAHFGDRCWVAGCDDRSRQTMAHGKPYRFGGSNRFWNLARYCLDHHRQFDGGQWKVVINGEAALLIDRRGLVVGNLRGLPPQQPRGPP